MPPGVLNTEREQFLQPLLAPLAPFAPNHRNTLEMCVIITHLSKDLIINTASGYGDVVWSQSQTPSQGKVLAVSHQAPPLSDVIQ